MGVIEAMLAGGAGAVARFGLSALVDRHFGRGGTVAVNLLGSFTAGWLADFALTSGARLVVVGGALGGFTTFSTWMLDALGHGSGRAAVRYAAWTFGVGLLAAGLGMAAGATAG